MILFGDTYYLFASHGSGYWTSDNLADWKYIPVDTEKYPEFVKFAPGVCVVGKTMYLTHSEGGTILKSETPSDPDSWINIGKPYDWQDPAFWTDEDGYVYAYDGCSDVWPIRVSKLDPSDNMKLVEGPTGCCESDILHRGFERAGENNENEIRKPYFEGAWMNKIGDKYYLTYAAPGTEFAVYADGCFIGDSPMGPFRYCENSPVVFKSTGFLRGSGHGCVFEDKKGRLWKMDTVSISVNNWFERRMALFPAKIGKDGLLYTNTEYGDYPMYVPDENGNPFDCPGPDWALLSIGSKAKASSELDENHSPDKSTEEDSRKWWSAKTGNPGEFIETDLGRIVPASALQISFADQDIVNVSGRNHGYAYRYKVEYSADGVNYVTIRDANDEDPLDYSYGYYEFEEAVPLRYVRVTNKGKFPAEGKMAVSGIRVFGREDMALPAAPEEISASRCEDTRSMNVRWKKVSGASGYIVRFGINRDELNTHFRLYGDVTELRVNCLNRDVPYYVTVSAFGTGGRSENGDIVRV